MNRLTKMGGMAEYEMVKCYACNLETAGQDLENCGLCEQWQKVLDRLAAYEDTGLEPEEAARLAARVVVPE